MGVKAVWTKDGKEDKSDPEGTLYLTDQRLLFEQKEEVATKKGTLIPYLLAYADKTNDLAAKMTAVQIPLEEQIADEKVAQAQATVDKSIHQVNELTVNIETEEKKLEYAEGKRALGDEKFGYGQAINAHEMALTDTYQNVLEADHAVGIAANDAIIPDARFRADGDIADDPASGGDERAVVNLRNLTVEGHDRDIGAVDSHGRSLLVQQPRSVQRMIAQYA